jgi:hypothetical protein
LQRLDPAWRGARGAAAWQRLSLQRDGTSVAPAEIVKVAERLWEEQESAGWQYACEALAHSVSSGVGMLANSCVDAAEHLLRAGPSPEGTFRLRMLLAFAHYRRHEHSQAHQQELWALDVVADIAEPLLRNRLRALAFSNMGRNMLLGGQPAAAVASALDALESAPDTAEDVGANWFHTRRAIEAATAVEPASAKRIFGHWRDPRRPGELGTDPFYAAKQYARCVEGSITVLCGLGELEQADDLRDLAASYLDAQVAGWPREWLMT